jgi:hypothetical protein
MQSFQVVNSAKIRRAGEPDNAQLVLCLQPYLFESLLQGSQYRAG